jgi:hypothetical protein
MKSLTAVMQIYYIFNIVGIEKLHWSYIINAQSVYILSITSRFDNIIMQNM